MSDHNHEANDLISPDVYRRGFNPPAARSLDYYRNQFDKKIRVATRSQRVLPNFIIAGAQKSGTTSLYNYLIRHPHVLTSRRTEVHFFDNNYERGLAYYRSYFPLKSYCRLLSFMKRGPICTGESTPNYILYAPSLKRIARDLPGIKLILLLRNPVDRAYSHYTHSVRVAGEREPLPFMAAMLAEEDRIGDLHQKIAAGQTEYNPIYRAYSYLLRGKYVIPVRKIRELFAPEQVFIVQSERFFGHTAQVYAEILDFLGLPAYKLVKYEKVFHRDSPGYPNAHRQVPPMTDAEREFLLDYFAPYNEELFDLLGERFDWSH